MAYDKDKIAGLVKSCRVAKGYTQAELSERTGISLRSVQRIENGDVEPRWYTIKALAEHLGFDPGTALSSEASPAQLPEKEEGEPKSNRPRQWILSIGSGLLLLIGCTAFFSQAARFPETTFESLCFWGVVLAGYIGLLWRIWK